MRHVVIIQSGAAQLRIAQIESKRLHQMQDRAGHCAQADCRTGVAWNSGGVVAQVGRGGFGFCRVFGRQHRVDYGNRIAVRIGHEFVRAVIRFAVAVFEHFLDFGFRCVCALRVIGMLFVRHECKNRYDERHEWE